MLSAIDAVLAEVNEWYFKHAGKRFVHSPCKRIKSTRTLAQFYSPNSKDVVVRELADHGINAWEPSHFAVTIIDGSPTPDQVQTSFGTNFAQTPENDGNGVLKGKPAGTFTALSLNDIPALRAGMAGDRTQMNYFKGRIVHELGAHGFQTSQDFPTPDRITANWEWYAYPDYDFRDYDQIVKSPFLNGQGVLDVYLIVPADVAA